jgi:hypothetical protein
MKSNMFYLTMRVMAISMNLDALLINNIPGERMLQEATQALPLQSKDLNLT